MATRLPLNTFRSLVLVLGGLALAANWLYVPWTYTLQRPGSAQVRTPGGYAFLNSPPPRLRQTNVDGVEIDFGRVLLQTAALGAVALVGLSLLGLIGQLRGRGPSPARSRSPKPLPDPPSLGGVVTSHRSESRVAAARDDTRGQEFGHSGSAFREEPSPLRTSAAGSEQDAKTPDQISERVRSQRGIRFHGRPLPVLLFWTYLTFC